MKRTHIAATLLLSAVAASALPAQQSNLALMANDHYTRSHDYDLVHQRIVVSAFNLDSLTFEGVVTSTLISRRPQMTSFIFDEGALLTNRSVTDRAGRKLTTSRTGDTIVVHPAQPIRFGDTLTFTISYHGKIKSGDGLTFIRNDGLEHRPDQIWSQGEDHSNHYWFPTYDYPNDKMTWELVATVPAANLAIANGKLVSNVVTGANRTMTWNQDTPSASYLVSLIVAPLVVTHDSWQGIPVDYYTYRADSARAWPLFHITTDMIGTYSKLTGVRYPWAKYAQTTVADFFGGMENVSATTLVDWLPDARAYPDRPWYQHILIPHELAHQWFGDYVTTLNWANTWLNEGFAEFMPGQYWNEKLGSHAEQDYYVDEHDQYLGIESRRSMPLASMGSNNIYPKGALVLKMLKDYLGPERFWASVHTYLTSHAFGGATSDDLRQAVLAATGENLDWFWDEWIYAAGHPQITVTSAYDKSTAKLTLRVEQTQVDSFKVDSTGRLFRVPQAFRMPVSIRVGTGSGERTIVADIHDRVQTVTVDSVAAEPTMVIFDDGNRMLKELTFDQPVAWLVEQLRRDQNLWDRNWVMQQLAKHPRDPAAQVALTDAAMHADYFLTRVEAINALDAFEGSSVIDALTTAAHDTSAAVRGAAIGGLGKFATPTVMQLASTMFSSDTSYQVRAAALVSAIRTNRSRTHEFIDKGLSMESYQDVIVTTALQAASELVDTASTDKVHGLIGQLDFATHTLAIFAGKGSQHAADLMAADLHDRRAAVRRWTVASIRQTLAKLDKAAAVRVLKAGLPTITQSDTREEVSALIVTLEKS